MAAPLETLRKNKDKTGRGQAVCLYTFLEEIGLPERLEERVDLLARRGQLLLAAGLGLCLWEDVRIARNRERGTLAQSRWRYWLSLAGLAFVLLLFGRYGPGFDAQDFVYFKF